MGAPVGTTNLSELRRCRCVYMCVYRCVYRYRRAGTGAGVRQVQARQVRCGARTALAVLLRLGGNSLYESDRQRPESTPTERSTFYMSRARCRDPRLPVNHGTSHGPRGSGFVCGGRAQSMLSSMLKPLKGSITVTDTVLSVRFVACVSPVLCVRFACNTSSFEE